MPAASAPASEPKALGARLAMADLAQAPGQRRERQSDQGCAERIEAPCLDPVRGRGQPQQSDGEDRERRIDPEHGFPAEAAGQPAAGDGARSGGERRRRRPHADRPGAFLLRISGADERKACRGQQGRGGALDDARADQPADRWRERAGGRHGAEHEATDRQYAGLAVRVGERAADQRQGRKRQQVAVHHPLDGAEVGPKGGAQARQRDVEYRTVDECHRGCEHAGRENDAAARRRDFAAQLLRTRFGAYHAAATRIAERVHPGLHGRPRVTYHDAVECAR